MNTRLVIGFLLLLVVYQTSEGLQTVFAPTSPLGPALMVLTLVLAWPVGRWIDGGGFRTYGLVATRWLPLLVSTLLLASIAKLAAEAIALGLGVEQFVPATPLSLTVIGIGLVTTFIPSIAEDILTRGFLLRFTSRPLGFGSYVIASAALYTANHIWRLDWGVSEQIRLFCLGLAYAAAAWRMQSLWAAVGLHWGWNLSNSLLSQAWQTTMADPVEGRWISAAVHLILFAFIALYPAASGEKPNTHQDFSSDAPSNRRS